MFLILQMRELMWGDLTKDIQLVWGRAGIFVQAICIQNSAFKITLDPASLIKWLECLSWLSYLPTSD